MKKEDKAVEPNVKESDLRAELDYKFQQLQTQINEVIAGSDGLDDKGEEKEDIGSELCLIKNCIKDKPNLQPNLLDDFDASKRKTVLMNYDRHQGEDSLMLKEKAINDIITFKKSDANIKSSNNSVSSSVRNRDNLFSSKDNANDHSHNKRFINTDKVFKEEDDPPYYDLDRKLFTNPIIIKKSINYNIFNTINSKEEQSSSKHHTKKLESIFVDPKDIILEEIHKDKCQYELGLRPPSNKDIPSNANVSHDKVNQPLKLKRLKDVRLNSDLWLKSIHVEEEERLKESMTVGKRFLAGKNLLSKIKIDETVNSNLHTKSNRPHHKKNNSCSYAKNHSISQLAFDIFNAPQKQNKPKGNSKITFLTHTPQSQSQTPLEHNFEWEFHLISSFEVDPDDEKEYSLLHPQSSLLNSSLLFRKAIISNSYFSTIAEASKAQKALVFTSDYSNFVKENYESLKQQYSFFYSKITIEEQNALFNTIAGKEAIEFYSQQREKEKGECLIPNLYSKMDFINSYGYQLSSFNNSNDIGFDFYRKFDSDGNSFYRAFMFAYVEHLFMFKRIDDLMALFVDILRLSDYDRSLFEEMALRKLMTFFSMESDLIRIGEYESAYKCFQYSYMNSDIKNHVDSIFLTYVKTGLFAILSKESLNKNDAPNDKGKGTGKITKSELELILQDQMEPSQLVLEAIPHLFNVKLKIFNLEGEGLSSSIHQFDYCKSGDGNLNNNDSVMICLGNFFSNYNCIYSRDFYETNAIFRRVNQSNLMKDQLNISKNLIGRNCIKCNATTKKVIFHMYKAEACLDCLMKTINAILLQRAVSFASEGYINLEYYSRRIILNNNQLYITNTDMIRITGHSFSYLLSAIISGLCFNCLDKKPSLPSLSCSCQFCKDCILIILRSQIHKHILIKSNENKPPHKISCLCQSFIDYSEVITSFRNFFRKEEDHLSQGSQFLQFLLQTCFVCLKDIINDSLITNKSKESYYKFSIPSENNIKGIEDLSIDHVICTDCYSRLDNNKYDQMEGVNVKGETVFKSVKIVQCNLCNAIHCIDKRLWLSKSKAVLCSNKCLIY